MPYNTSNKKPNDNQKRIGYTPIQSYGEKKKKKLLAKCCQNKINLKAEKVPSHVRIPQA